MTKIFIPFIAFIIICINVTAQEKSTKEIKGDKHFFNYSFDKAIVSYTHAKELSMDGQRKLAESYHNMDQNIQSEAVYLKLVSAPAGILPEDYYNYARVLKINDKNDEYGKMMDKFAALKPGDLRAKDYTANKFGVKDPAIDEGSYKIVQLNVNTNELDFGTCYYKNKIVFASTTAAPKMIVKKYNWTRKPFWDMYISDVDSDQLKNPKIFDKGLNGNLHDGPASFNRDGTYMAFTRNNYNDKSPEKIVELQIYFSTCKNEKWSKPESFVLNNPAYSIGQPCLTPEGNTMYFTSDMPGGYGGADLYRISKDANGVWGKPENLGDAINTEGDEMFPFFEANNEVLFFASNGRFGLGGLDIFIVAVNGPGFGPVINAGAPLNTKYNDFAAIANDKLKQGYFTSDRPGGSGGDDIYFVDILKMPDIGRKLKIITIDSIPVPAEVAVIDSRVRFTVNAPRNIPTERSIREVFPLRNYVFFTTGSTEIPDRYVLLKKDQVKDFKEDQVELVTPKNWSGRSKRQMIVYYNILNILGDRMGKNPLSTIKLVGSSAKGPDDGRKMAESVKQYLVSIFGLDASRITIEGRDKPYIPSEQPGGIRELELLREGDQRVSIESDSPALLMEFQSGPDAPLKPMEIITMQEAPLDSYVSFYVDGGKEAFYSWSLEIKDEKGTVQNYGPYTQDRESIPGKSILGALAEGEFNVTMIGQTKSGTTVKMDTTVNMVLWTPPKNEEAMRFSIIYEFNDSKAITIYTKYLTEIVMPMIPIGGKVIIHGYTDIIGDEDYNFKLSHARANDVEDIFENGLSKAGRRDVKFEVYGFGEDQKLSQFENKYPEERFYNRTVMIDIIPNK